MIKANRNFVFAAIILCGIVAYVVNLIYPPFDALFFALVFGTVLGSFLMRIAEC